MLYPPTHYCMQPDCPRDTLLRCKDPPRSVSLFTFEQGVLDAFSIHLYCCRSNYHHNYVVRNGTRVYYEGVPQFIQVSEHKFIAQPVLALFTSLALFSWTSATNAAQIYNSTLSHLHNPQYSQARHRLRTEHVWDGFVINALLKDARDRCYVLRVLHTGDQKDRFTNAMQARNDHMNRSGQPEFLHCCTRCVRLIPQPDGSTAYIDVAVTDGIEMGRPCCGVRNCTEALLSTQDRYCPSHTYLSNQCVIAGCSDCAEAGFRTCADPVHRQVESWHILHGKAMFTLRHALLHAHNTSGGNGEDTSGDGPCTEKPDVTNRSMKAVFTRRRTHNEQIILRPCGIILKRATFYGSEAVSQVLKLFRTTYPNKELMPRAIFYDNNCHLWKHSRAIGETFHEEVGLPVDVFHWKSKHKKADVVCSMHCNPYAYPELRTDNDEWFFNSSIAEQNNVWAGGYAPIIREMTAIKHDFFLDEMVKEKNALTRSRLESAGCRPGYRPVPY
ncbi:hypothetical protein GY45DRAFT_1262886 [Cubamyces sp. BRFM 1775]|nr:hypothetical protein GY45DRAFT_1262886 [Cubamyces sp. BRFM 1775]